MTEHLVSHLICFETLLLVKNGIDQSGNVTINLFFY